MPIADSLVQYSKQELIEKYRVLSEKDKLRTLGGYTFTQYTIPEVDSSWVDYVTITGIVDVWPSPDNTFTIETYTPYYGDYTADQIIPQDDYVLLPLGLSTTTSYISDTTGDRVVIPYFTFVVIPVNYIIAQQIQTYFNNPIPENDFDLVVSDYLTSGKLAHAPSDWGSYVALRYTKIYGDTPNFAIDDIAFNIYVPPSGGLAKPLPPPDGINIIEATTTDQFAGETFQITITNDIGINYLTRIRLSIPDTFDGKELDLYYTQYNRSYLTNNALVNGLFIDDVPHQYAKHTGLPGEEKFTFTADSTKEIEVYVYTNKSIVIDTLYAVEVQVPLNNVSTGTIKCSQYKWLYDNDFPSQSTPIIGDDNYCGAHEDGELRFDLVEYVGFQPAQEVLNTGEKWYGTNDPANYINETTFNGLAAADNHGAVYIGDNISNAAVKVKHDKAIQWIIDRWEYINIEYPQLVEDSGLAKAQGKYGIYKIDPTFNKNNIVPVSTTNRLTQEVSAETPSVEETFTTFVSELSPVELKAKRAEYAGLREYVESWESGFSDTVGLKAKRAEYADLWEYVESWESGFSDTVEMNALIQAQNNLEDNRVEIENMLVHNAPIVEQLDVLKEGAIQYAQLYTEALDQSRSIDYTKKESLRDFVGPSSKGYFKYYIETANEYAVEEQKYLDMTSQAELDYGIVAATQEELHNTYVDLLSKYDIDSLKGIATDMLALTDSTTLEQLNIGLLEVDMEDKVLDTWFDAKAEAAIERGSDKAVEGTYGTTSTYVSGEDAGYQITINKELISKKLGVYGQDLMDAKTEFITAHETQHLYQRYFNPLSMDEYKLTDEGNYQLGSDVSTSWAEDEANVMAALSTGWTYNSEDYRYYSGWVTSALGGSVKTFSNTIKDADNIDKTINKYNEMQEHKNPVFNDNPVKYEENLLISDYEATMNRLQRLKWRKKQQEERGR